MVEVMKIINLQTCNLGQAWATDIGVWCWLKDVFLTTNILSLDDNTITEYGTNAFDYESNVLYRIGGYIPSPTPQLQICIN